MASIVVVGGGVAGLTCAWRLQRAGHDVEVIERESRAGGRMQSESHDAFTVDRGAGSFTAGDVNLNGVAKILGIDTRISTDRGAGDAVYSDGKFESIDVARPLRLIGSRALSTRAKARLARLPIEVLRHAAQLDGAHPERVVALDDRDLRAGLRTVVGNEALERVLAPLATAVLGNGGDEASFAAVLLALRSGALQRRPAHFIGGNGLLAETLASKVSVISGCAVTAIETETDGARIRYQRLGRESRVYADAVVVAVPGDAVAALCPKLKPDERGFFEGVRYSRDIVAHLLCERAPRAGGYGRIVFPAASGLDLSMVEISSARSGCTPVGGAVVSVSLASSACDSLWTDDDSTIAAWASAQLARTPVGNLEPIATVIHRWPTARPLATPGRIAAYAKFLRRLERSPRIGFAGDYLLGGRVESAVTSGMRAASEIPRSL